MRLRSHGKRTYQAARRDTRVHSGLRREGRISPSIREIGKQFEIGSLRGVTVHLDALERKGYINRSNTPRSIKVVHPEFQPNAGILQLPLLGTIAAGQPILAEEHVDAMIPVPPGMVKDTDNAFLLRVIGDSMIGDGILESDLVVIRPQTNARNMDIVAFLLGDEATVKRINYEPNGSISSFPATRSTRRSRSTEKVRASSERLWA